MYTMPKPYSPSLEKKLHSWLCLYIHYLSIPMYTISFANSFRMTGWAVLQNKLRNYYFTHDLCTGDFMKKVPTATCALRDRYIVSIEGVYTPRTFFYEISCTYINVYLTYLPCYLLNIWAEIRTSHWSSLLFSFLASWIHYL